MRQLLIVAIPCIFSFLKPFAQVEGLPAIHITDSAVIAYYDTVMRENLQLYTGTEYANKGHNIQGFPYFENENLFIGAVLYDNNFYDKVSMQYDLVSDELVILDYGKNYKIKLLSEKVKYFVLDGRRFSSVLVAGDSLGQGKTGFYEELYSGNIKVFAKRRKLPQVIGKVEDNVTRYIQYNSYYIQKAGKMTEVDNEKAVLNVLGDRKQDLKNFIRSDKLNFRKHFEEAVTATAAYYDDAKK